MHVWTLERTRRLCSASFGFARTIGTERDSCLLGPTYKHSACTWMTQNHELDHPDHRTAGYSIILWIEFTDHFLHHVHLRKFSSVTCSSFALQVCNKKSLARDWPQKQPELVPMFGRGTSSMITARYMYSHTPTWQNHRKSLSGGLFLEMGNLRTLLHKGFSNKTFSNCFSSERSPLSQRVANASKWQWT